LATLLLCAVAVLDHGRSMSLRADPCQSRWLPIISKAIINPKAFAGCTTNAVLHIYFGQISTGMVE
jgi:hypothetical protein